jgi:hypothetical protein
LQNDDNIAGYIEISSVVYICAAPCCGYQCLPIANVSVHHNGVLLIELTVVVRCPHDRPNPEVKIGTGVSFRIPVCA